MVRTLFSLRQLARRALGPLLLAAVALPAAAQSEEELRRFDELDRVCEAAREKKLAPLRAERIERCVRDGRQTRAQCESEYAQWGNTRGIGGGRAEAGRFYDLPECVRAAQARERYRR